MRKLIFALFFLTASAIVTVGQTPCKTPYAPQGAGFAICPPDTLTKITRDGFDVFCKTNNYARDKCMSKSLEFAIVVFPKAVSESIEAVAFDVAVGEYEKVAAADLKAMDYFVTSSGDKGTRTVVELTVKAEKTMFVFYAFRTKSGTFVINGIFVKADPADLALVDSVMKTVAIAK